MRLAVRLTPRAARDRIGEFGDDGTLAVRVTAPPVDGKANDALCRLLAKRVGIAPSRVRVVRGESARQKLLELDVDDEAAARARLAGG